MKDKIYTIEVTIEELEDLISGLWAHLSEYCCGEEERKPDKDLIEKLELIKNNN